MWTRILAGLLASACLVLVAAPSAIAERATAAEMDAVGANWLSYVFALQGNWAGSSEPKLAGAYDLVTGDGQLLGRVYSTAPRGFIVVTGLKELPPIKAYSDECNLDPDLRSGLHALILQSLTNAFKQVEIAHGSVDAVLSPKDRLPFEGGNYDSWNLLSLAPTEFAGPAVQDRLGPLAEAGPLLATNWHQGAPYNDLCPVAPDGERTVVGCVATALAQIMRYYQWPASGTGSYSYTWNSTYQENPTTGDCEEVPRTGTDLSATYSDSYDWLNMPDDCTGGCSDAEEQALAELCYEAGVLVDMRYGSCSSGAFPEVIIDQLPQYLRYAASIQQESRGAYSAAGWFSLIQSEINEGRPMFYRFYFQTEGEGEGGHAIVCDGWRNTGGLPQYHMNYGWGGSQTAWYVIDELYGGTNPESEEYLLRGIAPEHSPSQDGTWQKLQPIGDLPPPLFATAAVYDPVRHRLVTHGGNSGTLQSSTWALDLTASPPAWQVLATAGPTPPARERHTAVYDPLNDRMIIYGGLAGTAVLSDAWALSFSGTPTWSQIDVSPAPAREMHSAVFDASGNRMIMFGGYISSGTPLTNETWALELSGTPMWARLSTSGRPPSARESQSAILDSRRQRMIVFSGNGGSDTTWVLNLLGAPSWLAYRSLPCPSSRYAHRAVYAGDRDQMVLFGGSEGGTLRHDSWVLNLATLAWQELEPSGPPPTPRYWHAAIYDEAGEAMVVFAGGTSNYSADNQLWALSFAAPAPHLVAVTGIPEQTTAGVPFTVTVTAENLGTGGRSPEGAINASVVYVDGTNSVTITDPVAPWAERIINLDPGQGTLHDPACAPINGDGLALDHVVEAVETDWQPNESHQLTFTVTPQAVGTVRVRVRTTMQVDGTTCPPTQYVNDHSLDGCGTGTDQQSWQVSECSVSVVDATGGTNPEAVVALHAKVHATKNWCTTQTPNALGLPCGDYVTSWPSGDWPAGASDVYLVVARGNPSAGISRVSLGIQYDPVMGQGVDVFGWSLCADLQFTNSGPNGEWPASGGGNRIMWGQETNCQLTTIGQDGVHAVGGAFYVYAYGSDVFTITPNNNVSGGPELAVWDCRTVVDYLTPDRAGSVAFSPDGTQVGYNPCSSAPPTVQVISPNGGDSLGTGNPTSIQWTASDDLGVTGITLEYSLNNGQSWVLIAGGVANTGTHAWTVPNEPSNACLVRVTATDGGQARSDSSDAVFLIQDDDAPIVAVTKPTLGQTVSGGDPVPIEWTANDNVGVDSTCVWVTMNGGIDWALLDCGAITSPIAWDAPGAPADSCKVRVQCWDEARNAGTGESEWFNVEVTGVPDPGQPRFTRALILGAEPNPFSSSTVISLGLPRAGWASLVVYDLRGRRVAGLLDGDQQAGLRRVSWSGLDSRGQRVATGIYFCVLRTAAESSVVRMLMLR